MNVYKLFIQGRQNTQKVGNVLYYSELPVGDIPFDADSAEDLGLAWWAQHSTNYLDFLPPAYTAEQIVVSIIDEGNRVVSPFDVRVPIAGAGTGSGESFTTGSTFIIGFYGTPVGGDFLEKVPKRSYIAYGPATENLVNGEGLVQLTAPQRLAIESCFEEVVPVGSLNYYPLRVGARKAVGATSAMVIANAVFRDFATFRKSRMTRPAGN